MAIPTRVGRATAIALSTAVAALVLGQAPAAWADSSVTIADNSFSPSMVTIGVGASVHWSYPSGNRTHTVTGSGWSSGELSPGGSYSRAFPADGTFSYVCSIHRSMTGTVIVGNGGTTTTTAKSTTTTAKPTTTQPPATTTPTTSGGGSNTTNTTASSGGTATTAASGGGGGSGSSTTKPGLTVTKGSVTRAVVTTPDGTPVTDPATGDTVLGEVVTTVEGDSDDESAAGTPSKKGAGGDGSSGSGGFSALLILLAIAAAIGGGLWWRRRSLPID